MSRISVDMDRYRRGTDLWLGTIVKRAGSYCWIQWDDVEGVVQYPEADVRYWVDTDRARITGPEGKTILDA